MIYFKDLKKGQEIKSSQLHPFILCSEKLLESPKQGKGIKKTMLIDAKGSELGFFDEIHHLQFLFTVSIENVFQLI